MKCWVKGLIGVVALGTVGMAGWQAWQSWRERPVWSSLIVPPALALPREFSLGEYRFAWSGQGFNLYGQSSPSKSLWSAQGGFLAAGIGRAQMEESRGALFVVERRTLLCQEQSVESFQLIGEQLTVKGHLRCSDSRVSSYSMSLRADGARGLQLAVKVDDPALNRLYLSWARDADEQFFGFGEQFSQFDLAGHRLPILVQEQGLELGLRPMTPGARRIPSAPEPYYVTSKLRSFFSESAAYQVFDLRDEQRVQLEVHETKLSARVYAGESSSALVEAHASVVGRRPSLPD
ncbi:hypothetical protein NVV93_11790 [Pseudomonas sp. LS44]|uniref:hypothetical protein n=1 Tax=Pseudomonas sp. LS44 TaxID=1357074 RepID=UPI00215AB8EB|nr:hypothetical protein [Pseudomonas sp. LS44]UVE16300.1 hypothetical protein NVV93_11790 [Pseudomonas sp. LS44]